MHAALTLRMTRPPRLSRTSRKGCTHEWTARKIARMQLKLNSRGMGWLNSSDDMPRMTDRRMRLKAKNQYHRWENGVNNAPKPRR